MCFPVSKFICVKTFSPVIPLRNSVPDPDPNAVPGYPPDPHAFGPPGSGSFCHQAKIVRKTLNPTVLCLFLDFLSLKNYVK